MAGSTNYACWVTHGTYDGPRLLQKPSYDMWRYVPTPDMCILRINQTHFFPTLGAVRRPMTVSAGTTVAISGMKCTRPCLALFHELKILPSSLLRRTSATSHKSPPEANSKPVSDSSQLNTSAFNGGPLIEIICVDTKSDLRLLANIPWSHVNTVQWQRATLEFRAGYCCRPKALVALMLL